MTQRRVLTGPTRACQTLGPPGAKTLSALRAFGALEQGAGSPGLEVQKSNKVREMAGGQVGYSLPQLLPCQTPPRHTVAQHSRAAMGCYTTSAVAAPTREERQGKPVDAGAGSWPEPPAGMKQRGRPHSGEPCTAPAAMRLQNPTPQRANDVQPETLCSQLL
ncbi:hypothetical protein NDU88_008975 [Pleurodeles waltl]|uniref:Uncharacterized protein n=1 Tax=Pleurodeles waltl TaxID=8319 RepID=A0AAV7PUR4_PLEWA|nr:hypothetical protein NDU88_008975 [Pleurodeles waltl]